MNLFFTAHIITSVSVLLLGAFVVYKKPHQETAWYFGLFSLGTVFWSISLFIAISQLGQPTLWGRLAISFGSFMPAGFFLFFSSFPKRDKWFGILRVIITILSVFFFFFALSPLVVERAWIVNKTYLAGNLGRGYFIFWIYYLGFLVVSFFKCIVKLRFVREPLYRNQLLYATVGFLIFFFPLLITQFILPLWGIFKFNSLGPLFSLPMVVLIAYAIVRHHLLDIRIVIQRGIVYTILLVVLVGVYSIALGIFGYILHAAIHTTAIVSAGLVMVLGIFFLQPLKEYFQKVTDHIFYKDGYDYASALHMLTRTLYTNLSEEEIVRDSSAIMKEIFKTDEVSFTLDPEAVSEGGRKDGFAGLPTLSAPIMFDNKIIGLLRLGPKRSGDIYTIKDFQLVSTFSFQSAIALGKAKLHKRVQEYSTQLEHLVEERTGEIKKLQEDQRHSMIDISHNLQTPLAVIRGEIELLSELYPDPEKINVLKKSIDRVSSFIRQLLHLSRLEHSVLSAPLKPVDLVAILKEQIDYFEVMAEERGVKIISSVSGKAPILGDKRLIEELFTNLVINAIKYRRTDIASSIEIRINQVAKGFIVEVEDNGVGIAPEDIEDIFIRFHRISRTSHNLQGTGLGLAIAKKIIEKHNGTIAVESSLGKHTIFTLFFPKRNSNAISSDDT
jgi:signal transduction histidine kinase